MPSAYGAKCATDARFGKGHPPVPVRLPDADDTQAKLNDHDGVLAEVIRIPRTPELGGTQADHRRLDDRGPFAGAGLIAELGWSGPHPLVAEVSELWVTLRCGERRPGWVGRAPAAGVDARGRVRLSPALVAGLGIKAGQKVLVETDPAQGILRLYHPEFAAAALTSARRVALRARTVGAAS